VLFAAALAAACQNMASRRTGATTNPTGAWHLDGVPSGRHHIAFKKETFGTVHILGQSVSAPSTTGLNIVMAIMPWQQAIIDSIYVATHSGRNG
jgi:hypothetical protein